MHLLSPALQETRRDQVFSAVLGPVEWLEQNWETTYVCPTQFLLKEGTFRRTGSEHLPVSDQWLVADEKDQLRSPS